VLHGTRNATQHLQSILVMMMENIKENIKVWLDDCLLHAKTENLLLGVLRIFLTECATHGLKLHASKCVLFARDVKYCGRNINKDGVLYDPEGMAALQNMEEPKTGGDLVQYMANVNWMRSAIQRFAERVSPLQAVLKNVFDGKTRRTKKAARAVALEQLWGDGAREAFKDIQSVIADSMTMAYPDPSKRICVLTDASERFYAGIVTQVDESQLDLPIEQQDHQPLSFVYGEFKGAPLRWTVPEKEGFAVVDVVTKMDYILLIPSEFSILSDHLNLTYIYNPLSVDPMLARQVVHKLQRWALKMSVFAYRMEHVAGEVKFWTDLMISWGVGWVVGAESRARVAPATIFE
jgi:RNase H-like domain found in reverse transcriptase